MKILARLLAGGVIAASFTLGAAPADACDDPRKCASCYRNPNFGLDDLRPFLCYS